MRGTRGRGSLVRMPAKRQHKPHFNVIVSFWSKHEQTFIDIPLDRKNVQSDAVLLKQVFAELTDDEVLHLATISIAQNGGKAAPWIAAHLKEYGDDGGGYRFVFRGVGRYRKAKKVTRRS